MTDFPIMRQKKPLTLAKALTGMDKRAIKFIVDIAKQNPDLKLQSFLKFPSPWRKVTEPETIKKLIDKFGSVNHRSIVKNEIVIDVDSESKAYGLIHLTALEKQWNALGYRRSQWDSGGDGFHVNFIFKSLDSMANEDISEIKKELIYYLCNNLMFMYKNKNQQYIFSNKNYNKNTREKKGLELCSHICTVNKSLIQIEYAPHRKGGSKKPFITGLGFTDMEVIEGKTPRIPKVVYDIINERKEERKKERDLSKFVKITISNNQLPNSIRFYLGEVINGKRFTDFEDGHKRALFHLASFFKHTKPFDELVDFLNDWVNKISIRKTDSFIMSRGYIEAIVKGTNGSVSERARKELLEELDCLDICEI